MLILKRKTSEKVIIESGGKIVVVTAAGVDRHQIRLGFEAPQEIVIYREELWEQIKSEGER